MIAELGTYALIIALWLAVVQAGLLLVPDMRFQLVRPAAIAQWFAISLAFACLIFSFAISDFSVRSVVEHSHTAKPLIYKMTGAWGHHEGSMILWVWVLASFGFAFSIYRMPSHTVLQEMTLSIQGFLAAGFLLFILLTSSPFIRVFPPPQNGQDLNPLLQDIGLAIHPPMLYLGYVGFSLVFSLAVTGLWLKSIDRRWAQLTQPWILIAWSTLTLGIGLGSWWAYRELGWGGWWFWDPVENASLMPWLAGTALLHANLVLAQRNTLARWVALLAILTFSLSLLGTFLVRSGVLTSVHSFASDPARGLFVLAYIVIITGGGLTLYTMRAPALTASGKISPISREGSIVLNNLFIVTACFAILLATLYPLFLEWITDEKVSIGPPYFHRAVLPIFVPILALAALGPMLAWRKGLIRSWKQLVSVPMLLTAAAAVITYMQAPSKPLFAAAGMALATWLATATVSTLAVRIHLGSTWTETSTRLRQLPASYYGMITAHLGVAIFAAGVTASSLWQVETEQSVTREQTLKIGPFDLAYAKEQSFLRENYVAKQGTLTVTKNNKPVTILEPELRTYPVRNTQTSESSIYTTFLYDLYAVMGKTQDPAKTRLRMYYTPLMNWVWAGFVCIAAGGLLSLLTYQRHGRA